jgi:hypothetical protein
MEAFGFPIAVGRHRHLGVDMRRKVQSRPPGQALKKRVDRFGIELRKVRIPVHAGHQFRSMPGHDSGPCRATIPVDAGRGV